MRSIYLIAFGLLAGQCGFAQTLFTYGPHKVTKEEFLRAYNKNKVASEDETRVMKDYLDLYASFKLKVQAAKELHFDTLQQIRNDVKSFRSQVQENYLNDETTTNILLQEALTRSATDIHVLYFSVPVENAPNAERAIRFIHSALTSGRTDYAALATNASSLSPSRYQDVGFINVFSIPYNFEQIVYGLKPGQVSEPYKTASAWHIFKSAGERPNPGKWKVSQILFALPPDASPEQVQFTRRRADSVYNLLKAGRNFSEAAREFSDDKLSYSVGGELPEFSTGKYDVVFEKNVFALKKDGDLSAPFETPFGFHIIKRMSHSPFPGTADGTLQYEMRLKLLKDARMQASREKFNNDIRLKTGFKETKAVPEAELLRLADTVMSNLSREDFDNYPVSNKTIIRFKKSSLKVSDWLRFVRDYKANYELDKGEKGKALWDRYTEYATLQYYKDHLEEYNEAFAFQMKEFEEGNMLFEIMEKNVWGKASADSAGLSQYYQQHKGDYKWGESADMVIFNAPSKLLADSARKMLQQGRNWTAVAAELPEIHTDSGRFELSQVVSSGNPLSEGAGSISAVKENNDGSASFIQFLKIYSSGDQKSFNDARGQVINDYQHVLEENWLNSLRKKYPVKMNDAVVHTLFK